MTDGIDARNKIGGSRRPQLDHALDRELAAFIRESSLTELFCDISAHDDAILQRNLTESFKVQPDIDVDAMQEFLVVGRSMHRERIKAVRNWQGWGLERSEAMTAWVEIDQMAVEATWQRNVVVEEVLGRLGAPIPPSPPVMGGAP